MIPIMKANITKKANFASMNAVYVSMFFNSKQER
jgi:hypothetical protein